MSAITVIERPAIRFIFIDEYGEKRRQEFLARETPDEFKARIARMASTGNWDWWPECPGVAIVRKSLTGQ